MRRRRTRSRGVKPLPLFKPRKGTTNKIPPTAESTFTAPADRLRWLMRGLLIADVNRPRLAGPRNQPFRRSAGTSPRKFRRWRNSISGGPSPNRGDRDTGYPVWTMRRGCGMMRLETSLSTPTPLYHVQEKQGRPNDRRQETRRQVQRRQGPRQESPRRPVDHEDLTTFGSPSSLPRAVA